jgi:hypothetical protein
MNRAAIRQGFLLFAFCLFAAARPQTPDNYSWPHSKEGGTIESRFPVPKGYTRIVNLPGSFAFFLRQLPLKKGSPPVYLYDLTLKGNQTAHIAVVDIDVPHFDLQQCADAVIRLRAEYFYCAGLYDKIAFHYTSGDLIPFSKWAMGLRPAVLKKGVGWSSNGTPGKDRKNFMAYMNNIFTYAGTQSLNKELMTQKLDMVRGGDVWIKGGSPGHAVLVLDAAEDDKGNRIFLLGQSYMPAQDFQVLKNPGNPGLSPWYSEKESMDGINTPEWDFSIDQLKKFPE